jgi:hypothetical protein
VNLPPNLPSSLCSALDFDISVEKNSTSFFLLFTIEPEDLVGVLVDLDHMNIFDNAVFLLEMHYFSLG